MSGYSCRCGAVSTSPAKCCGQPMGSAPAVNQAAIARHLITGTAQAAREAAKNGRGKR